MSPILRKIRSYRKIKQKYSKLQHKTATSSNNNTPSTASDTMGTRGDTTGDTTGDAGKELGEDSDWETVEVEVNTTTTFDTSSEQSDGVNGQEEQELATGDKAKTDNRAEPEEGEVHMDWESTYSSSDCTKESEEIDDEALGEVELSELLKLEKEQPDDLLPNLEVPARPESPKHTSNNAQDNVPSSAGTMPFDFKEYENEDEKDEEDEEEWWDEYPATDFIYTHVFVSDAEWSLQYRPKSASCLRTCYTVIVQEDVGTME